MNVRVEDDGGLSTTQLVQVIVVDVLELPAPNTLVRSDLTGSNHGNNLPYTGIEELAEQVEFSGWSLGSGLTGSDFHGLSFFGAYPSSESDLTEAMANDRYLGFSINADPGFTIDLRDAIFAFQVDRLTYHSPRQYVVSSSIDGFSSQLFTSNRLTTTGAATFAFPLPTGEEYSMIESVEFRIYAFAGRYTGHDASLTEFELTGRVDSDE